MAPPHTEASIRAIYAPLAEGDFKTYMEHVADNVDWVIGNPDLKTFPPAGRWDVRPFPSQCMDSYLSGMIVVAGMER